jgi:hypothetical protein
MIRCFVRWMQWTLPPTWIVVLAVFFYLCWESIYLWLRYWASVHGVVPIVPEELLKSRDGVVAVIMAAYGVFHLAAFHPIFRAQYRGWLELTPWTSRKPLPLGPIHLVWQDVLVLGIAALALHGTPLGWLWMLWAFLLAYLGTLGLSFWLTGPWWMGYVILFGLGLSVRMAAEPLAALVLLAPLYGVAMVGRAMALARFPWQDSKSQSIETMRQQFFSNSMPRQGMPLGWPNGQLVGLPAGDGTVRRRDGILGPLLGAWWLYAFLSNITDADGQEGTSILAFVFVAMAAIVVRMVIYMGPGRPPISLRGRIATGHLVIPGYDYVLVAPLCATLTAFVGFVAAILAGQAYSAIVCPLASAAALIVALNMGPSLKKWRLTGRHRIAPWGGSDPNRVQL